MSVGWLTRFALLFCFTALLYLFCFTDSLLFLVVDMTYKLSADECIMIKNLLHNLTNELLMTEHRVEIFS